MDKEQRYNEIRDYLDNMTPGYSRKVKIKPLNQMTREELLDYLHDTKEGQQMKEDIKSLMKNKK